MVIKEAEKGSTIVLLNKHDYRMEINSYWIEYVVCPLFKDPIDHTAHNRRTIHHEAMALDHPDESTSGILMKQ